MCDSRNFRISVNLNNFFHDHRAMCKIFVNEEMKCIKHLEQRISKIFDINNFHLVLQNHYLPPTEDTRILQSDDILFVIPHQEITSVLHASTTWKQSNNDAITQHMEKEDDDCSFNVNYTRKAKKRNKHESDLGETNNKYCIDQEDISNNIKKPRKKKKKANTVNLEAENLDTSVKEKVVYFENQINLEELDNRKEVKDHSNNIHDLDNEILNKLNVEELENQKEVNKNSNGDNDLDNEVSGNKKVLENITETVVVDDQKEENNSNNYRHKKLFLQKRNTDLISFNLPKNSNIVKSILISKESLDSKQIKPLSADISAKMKDILENSKNHIKNNLENKKNNCEQVPTCSSLKTNNCHINAKCNIQNIVELNERQKIDYSQEDPESVCVEKKNTKIIANKNTSTPLQNEKFHNNELTKEIEIPQTTKSFCMDETSPDKSIKETLINNTSNNSIIDSDTELYSKIKNIYSEPSLCDTMSCSSAFSDKNSFSVNTEFITKRKRKRSHKKRKPKISTDEKLIPTSTPIHQKMFYPTAEYVNHIKFNDDGETIGDNNAGITEDSLKKTTDAFAHPMDIPANVCLDATVCNTELHPTNEEVQARELMEKSDICASNGSARSTAYREDDIKETTKENCNIRISNDGNASISDDVIFRSPLMTSTKPRSGDVIAFQVLRLSHDYTPEISKFITGEVLSVSDDSADVDIKIIGGIDECREPDGKFSLEIEGEIEMSNVKTYCWKDMIKPRLIFP